MYRFFLVIIVLLSIAVSTFAQERTILVPQRVSGAPFMLDDSQQYFGKAYRWFHEGFMDSAVYNLRRVIAEAGYELDPDAHYITVAHFKDSFVPIGMLHGENADFLNTRLYGLEEDNLYYVFITAADEPGSFVSLMATAKDSPFSQQLPTFLGLLFGTLQDVPVAQAYDGENRVWVDVRQFTVPKTYRKFSDLSIMVKKDLSAETVLAQTVFDNTAKERWSFGLAMAVTSVSDIDLIVGDDGTIIARPKPDADPAGFAVINYHFVPIDTKNKTFGNSFHLLAGFRIASLFEPLIGVGGGVAVSGIDIHAFAGYSFEFANELKSGFAIGDAVVNDISPFKRKIRAKPRFGIEIKL